MGTSRAGARAKRRRPRDGLGRPRPRGTPNTLILEDFDTLSLEECHRLGREHFNAGRYFHAHEAWESAWRQAREGASTAGDVEFFKGLSQLGAGHVHLLRGNGVGAVRLLRRAASRLSRQPAIHRGVDARAVTAAAEADAGRIERGELTPGEGANDLAPKV